MAPGRLLESILTIRLMCRRLEGGCSFVTSNCRCVPSDGSQRLLRGRLCGLHTASARGAVGGDRCDVKGLLKSLCEATGPQERYAGPPWPPDQSRVGLVASIAAT